LTQPSRGKVIFLVVREKVEGPGRGLKNHLAQRNRGRINTGTGKSLRLKGLGGDNGFQCKWLRRANSM